MSDLPWPARAYIVGIVTLAFTLAAYELARAGMPAVDQVGLALAVSVFIALAWLFPLPISYKTKLYLDFSALTAAILLLEPGMAMLAAGAGAALAHALRREPLDQALFNSSQMLVQAATGSYLLAGLGGQLGNPLAQGPQFMLAIGAAAALMYLVNQLIVSGIIARQSGLSPARTCLQALRVISRVDVLAQLAQVGIGVMAAVMADAHVWALALLLLPAVAIYVVLERNIQLRRQVEGALRNTEASLAEAQRVAHLGSWEWDLASGEQVWSDEVYRIFGVVPGGLAPTYETFMQFVHPDDAAGLDQAVQDAVYHGTAFTIDHRVVLADGSERVVHAQGEVARGEDGTKTRIVGTLSDITQRVRAEQRIRAQAERLQVLAEASRVLAEASLDLPAVLDVATRRVAEIVGDYCGIHLLSEDGRWLRPATAFHRDSGVATSIITASAVPSVSVQLPPIAQTLQADRSRSIAGASVTALLPLIAPHQWPQLEGVRPHSILAVPLRVRKQPIGLLVIARDRASQPYSDDDRTFLDDIADRIALAVDNAQLYRQAQAAISARDDFLSIASHELKTPLTASKAAAQFLDRRIREPEIDRAGSLRLTGMLLSQTERLEELLGDLLDASRIQQGRLDLAPATIDLTRLAAEVLARFEYAPERTPAHTIVLDAPSPVIGDWDPTRMDQVFTNLISNALKYSPSGGEVRVSISYQRDQVLVAVRDQGIGIPADEQATLFQPFIRGESGRRQAGGTGLGLYITAKIVHLHGGTIAVDSTPGSGTTFTICLPLAQPTVIDADEQALAVRSAA